MCCQVKSWSHYHFLGDPCISLFLCEEAKKTICINKRICGKLASPDQFFWHPFLIELVPHKYCLHPSLNLAFRWLQQEGSSREAKKSNVLPVSCCTEFFVLFCQVTKPSFAVSWCCVSLSASCPQCGSSAWSERQCTSWSSAFAVSWVSLEVSCWGRACSMHSDSSPSLWMLLVTLADGKDKGRDFVVA